MVNQELVSVIIPVYNVEEYLQECVDSVLKQTYNNYEIILVDDGSTDASGKICDAYVEQDARIRVIHQKNQGLSGARNTGFAVSNGEYVYFLDSDDWILPETLEELMEKMKQENADVVFFEAHSFTDCPDIFQVEQRYLRKQCYASNKGYKVLEQLQKQKDYHSAVQLLLLKRSFIEENSLHFEPGIVYEDVLYTFEVFCKAKCVAHVRKTLYQRRYRSNSIMTSRKNKKHYVSAKVVYEKVRNIAEQLGILEDDTARKYIVRCAFNALNMYRKLSKAERKECKESYKDLKIKICKDRAYSEQELNMRCLGIVFWFMYKVYEKSLVRVLKGRK